MTDKNHDRSRLPVTIVIPCKNEALNLPECLRALGDSFHEVVVVDSNSSDDTPGIASRSGAVLLNFCWDGRFPKKRNWVLRNYKFNTTWVLFLDADERVTAAFIADLRRNLADTDKVAFWLRFNNWFLGQPLRYGDPFRKLALFRVGHGEYEQFPEEYWSHLDMEVHEHPILDGPIGVIESALEHRDFHGIEHYRRKHRAYAQWEARRFRWFNTAPKEAWRSLTNRQKFKYRNLDRWWLPWVYWFSCFVVKRGFLDGYAGWRFAIEKLRYFRSIRACILEQAMSRPDSVKL